MTPTTMSASHPLRTLLSTSRPAIQATPADSFTEEQVSPDERQFALIKYQADRAHELELDRTSGQFELAFFRGLFVMNGGAAAAFIAFAANVDRVLGAKALVWSALTVWSFGLVAAYIAGAAAYYAQLEFVAAYRARRHAIGVHLLGTAVSPIMETSAPDCPSSLAEAAGKRQQRGDEGWRTAHAIGMISAALFVIGGYLAARAVLG